MQRRYSSLASFLPPRLQPGSGDLLGFSGRDLLSAAINLGSLGLPRRGLSHVAIVANFRAEGPCLYESTALVGIPCLQREAIVDGMQCHDIRDRVIGYPGRVWHYRLRRPLGLDEADWLEVRLRRLCRQASPYDYLGALGARSTLVACAQRAKFGREDLAKLFCSELVAAMWADLRILKTSNASAWSPNALARYAVRHGLVEEPVEWATVAPTNSPASVSFPGAGFTYFQGLNQEPNQ